MENRKEVFQEKLLKRLFQLPPKTEKPLTTMISPGSVPEKTDDKMEVIRSKGAGGEGRRSRLPSKRVYTVLPPPAGHRAGSEESAVLSEPGDINAEGDPAAGSRGEDSPEPGSGGQRRRRRKRKHHGVPGGGGGCGTEEGRETGVTANSGLGEGVTGTAGCDTKMSKNKKRKAKKKRRKERLVTLGLMPSAAAVEFTYQPGGEEAEEDLEPTEVEEEEEEEEEEEGCREKRLAELLDFLQATQEICLSDRSSAAGKPQVPDPSIQGLLGSLSAGTAPPVDLARLQRLKSLVLLRDAGRLTGALEEFQRRSAMPPGEVSAICSLFRYWLTDILPMRASHRPGEQTTSTSAT